MDDLANIIQACLKRDTRAENALYKICFAQLLKICRRYASQDDDALDLLNRSFLKIIQSLPQYKSDLPFEKWAVSITVNTIIDEFRKRKNYEKHFSTLEIGELLDSQLPFDLNMAESNLSSNEILNHIRNLPEGSKEVFNLYMFEGKNHNEIAQLLNISEGTSRWHLSNARNRLKAKMTSLFEKIKLMVV